MINSLSKCKHIWGPIEWGTKIEYIPHGTKTVKQGSDILTVPQEYSINQVPCQITRCTKCGKIKYLDDD